MQQLVKYVENDFLLYKSVDSFVEIPNSLIYNIFYLSKSINVILLYPKFYLQN